MLGIINDLGYGYCPDCKVWKLLTSFYYKDKNKERKAKRRCCSKCNARYLAKVEPFFYVKKAIAAHKSKYKECDYNLRDLIVLHQWQAFNCCYCNTQINYAFTLDHIVPQKAGGRNIKSNILLACLVCNSSKQDFEVLYWLKQKNFIVSQKIITKLKGAYDEQGYEFKPG